ncbi:MAG: SDR family NAD(P)-dependent oxidoreductase [Dermatophilaceae bacterium]
MGSSDSTPWAATYPRSAMVIGATGGLGAPITASMAGRVDRLWSASRRPAQVGSWCPVDLHDPEVGQVLAGSVGGQVLDALVYAAGTWERDAFTSEYRFESSSDAEDLEVLTTNLVAPLRIIKALLPALRRSDRPKIVLVGALSGRDNVASPEVANSASKFGLRGAAHALRSSLRADRIPLTVVDPGNIATDEVISDLAERGKPASDAIPMADFLAVVECVLSMSRSTYVKEIVMPATADLGA